MSRGKFIVFEGIDGCGKSTQIQLLLENINGQREKNQCVSTFEPTDGPIGRVIRSALRKEFALSQEAMAMLYAADRAEHVEEVLSLLDSGVHVLCDRYYYSNFVYQSDAVSLERLMSFNRAAMDKLKPDLTIFLDASPEACIKKIAESREKPDLYETLDKLTKVRAEYLKVFELLKNSHNTMIIQPLETKYLTADLLWNRLKDEFFSKGDLR